MSVLVVIRGNSGSGKSTVARTVQQRFPRATCLVVPQDTVRRHMLRERDTPAAVNGDLIEHIATFGLARGLIVIVEGILDVEHYGGMLERLTMSATRALHYGFDLSFDQTLLRHAGRPQAAEFSPEQMAQWYHGWQPLQFVDEVRLDASWELGTIVERIYRDILHADATGFPKHPAVAMDSIASAESDRIPDQHSASLPPRPELRVAWFGTSLMEHFEAHHPRLVDQSDLPAIGSTVVVESWRNRGYVHAISTWMSARFPWTDVIVDNHGMGGATSADVLTVISTRTLSDLRLDLAVLSCGINDVWRLYQGRPHQAVDIDSYECNIHAALRILRARARTVLVIGEPPIGWDPAIDAVAANEELAAYNNRAHHAAKNEGIGFIDLWKPFCHFGSHLGWGPTTPVEPSDGAAGLWSDGVHLSELGVEVVRQAITEYLTDHRILEDLLAHES